MRQKSEHFSESEHSLMPCPELPDDIKDLVMFEWYLALWSRMHKRRTRQNGLYKAIDFIAEKSGVPEWEEDHSLFIDNDVWFWPVFPYSHPLIISEDDPRWVNWSDRRMEVVQQNEFREWALFEDAMMSWYHVQSKMLRLAAQC